MHRMAQLIEQWRKRTRRKSIALISFALAQVTAAAGLVWRMAAKDAAFQDDAVAVTAIFLCVSASVPLTALFRVIFVPSAVNPDAAVPGSLLRELSQTDLAEASVRAHSRVPRPAALTFRELLELDQKLSGHNEPPVAPIPGNPGYGVCSSIDSK